MHTSKGSNACMEKYIYKNQYNHNFPLFDARLTLA